MFNATEEEADKRRAELARILKFYCRHHIPMHPSISKEYHDLLTDSSKTGTDKPDTTIKERN